MRAHPCGYVDGAGYLRCLECVERLPQAERDRILAKGCPVWTDSPPHADEQCDTCKRPVREVRR